MPQPLTVPLGTDYNTWLFILANGTARSPKLDIVEDATGV